MKVLSLIDVRFDAKSLQNVISGCPVIDDLHVEGKYRNDHVGFSISKTLKYLLLLNMKFTCHWLEGLIFGLPLLERLTLNFSNGLKYIIRGHSLRKSLYYDGGSKNINIRSHSLTTLHVDAYQH